MTKAAITVERQADLRRGAALPDHAFPGRHCDAPMRARAAADRPAATEHVPDERGATSSSPGSASSPAPARASRRISRRSPAAPRRTSTRERFAPYPVHPAAAARTRPADPQEIRPAPDGALAAARRLRGRARPRLGRRQGRCRRSRAACTSSSRPAAASATTRSTAQILTGLRERRRSRRLPQRAPDGRPAPDPVPGAALEPARRQHLHRARRHRRLAHLHGRGSKPASTPCASPRRASPPARSTSSWSAAPTTPSAPTCC